MHEDEETVDYPMGVRQSATIVFPDDSKRSRNRKSEKRKRTKRRRQRTLQSRDRADNDTEDDEDEEDEDDDDDQNEEGEAKSDAEQERIEDSGDSWLEGNSHKPMFFYKAGSSIFFLRCVL